MKYFECIYNDGSGDKIIELVDVTEEKSKELEGKIFCNGVNADGVKCRAPLTPARNAFDGGKTMHFRARNELHIEGCPYKDIKTDGGKRSVGTIVDGYFTEDQINSFVRELDNRVSGKKRPGKTTNPGKPRKRKGKSGSEGNEDSNVGGPGRVRGGNIVAGDRETGKKGRMRTLTEVTEADIDTEVGIYGNLESFSINNHGEATLVYREERLKNIQVRIGQIYKNNNPQEFNKLTKVKAYVDYLIDNNKEIRCISAGLVNKYNDNLVIELQTNRSFRINGKSVWDIVRTQF